MSAEPHPHASRGFARALLMLAIALVAADLSLGFLLSRAYPTVGRGQLAGMVNSAIAARADLLILGASTASHHYDDRALSDSLGVRVFNTGLDGRGIVFSRGLLALAGREHAPRLVVVDLSYSDRDRTSARILAPFVGRSRVVDQVVGWSWRERVKLVSRCYRFNGLVLPILSNFRTPPMEFGFEPVDGAIADSVPWRGPERGAGGFGPWYGEELRALVRDARALGARIVFIESPTWGGRTAKLARDEYARVAKQLDVPFHVLDPEHVAALDHARLYYDRAHLNREGARVFTDVVTPLLRAELAAAGSVAAAAAKAGGPASR